MRRNILRQKAKKAYREAAKGVPKYQRMPFAKFYKEWVKSQVVPDIKEEEDFDLEDLINVNDISEDDDEEEQE